MTETQVGELLERATADIRTTTDLVAGGIAAGRRRRRRGLALTAVGSLATAGVAGVAVLALSGGGSSADHTVVADPSGSTGDTSYAAEPSAPPKPGPAPVVNDGPFPVAPAAMGRTLAPLVLGSGNPSDDQYHLNAPDGWQSGAVDVAGGSVSVSIEHSTGPRCDGDLAIGNHDCTDLGGGFFTSTYSADVMTKDGPTGTHEIGVTYYTPNGIKINATASNASSADPRTPTADEPVLDLAALTAIAENPAWQGK